MVVLSGPRGMREGRGDNHDEAGCRAGPRTGPNVDSVYAQLQHATRSARSVAAEGAALFASDRERYVREEDGTALFERDAFAFQAARRLAVLDAEHEGLVFGKLDLTDREIRYIGRIGVGPGVRAAGDRLARPRRRAVLPGDAGGSRWTSSDAACSAAATRSSSASRTTCSTRRRRPRTWPSSASALMAALSRARGHQMRDIVATIQAEQDEAIRAPYAGVTVIAGGPGTGKTVVGLHRTAYLLYSNRRRFENGGVLVVGPSAVFMNYIDRVLPSLGEDTMGTAVAWAGQSPTCCPSRPPASTTRPLRWPRGRCG